MEKLRLQILTWNVGGADPMSKYDLTHLLNVDKNVDIYVVSVQEIRQGLAETAMSFIYYDPWTYNMIQLFADHEYFLIENVRLQGLTLSVFARLVHLPHIQFIKTGWKRAGFGGYWGNKGGLAIACKIYGKTICFTNLHLAAHLQCNEERIAQFDSILNDLELKGIHSILNHDVVFLAGDMNFRVDSLSLEEIKAYLNKSQYNELLLNDQLRHQFKTNKIMKQFFELPILFPPTYKFDVGTDDYDTSKKSRLPAWTDRILYRVNPDLDVVDRTLRKLLTDEKESKSQSKRDCHVEVVNSNYDSLMRFRLSDHKPVVAQFDLMFVRRSVRLVEQIIVDSSDGMKQTKVKFNEAYTSEGYDYLALYEDKFCDFRDYKTWMYLPSRSLGDQPLVTYNFPSFIPQCTGRYRVAYFSHKMSCLLFLGPSISLIGQNAQE